MIRVQLPDGTVSEHADDATALDVAGGISERLAQQTVGVVITDEAGETPHDAFRPLRSLTAADPIKVRLLTTRDDEALAMLRHSAAHVMAQAVMRLYPGVSLAFGPATATGYYYDIDSPEPIREEDFPKIEQEMKAIVKERLAFERFEKPRDEATELVAGMDQSLKVEHIATGLAEFDTLSFYRQGEFVDLCRGPHVPHTGFLKAIKLMSVAGSYWKGDANGRQLQRLYGTAFFDKKPMKAFLTQLEEAKKRDHRTLGKKHGLFTISEKVGQGLPLWLPKGATVRAVLEDLIKTELLKRGYEPVYSPHLGRVELYETSGHFPYYRDSQFPPLFEQRAGQIVDTLVESLGSDVPMPADEEAKLIEAATVLGFDAKAAGYDASQPTADRRKALDTWQRRFERYLVKPMNCPHHTQMYKAIPRSYKDLPVRLAEFGTVYRHEQSGELNGLLRVRGLTQDDAHIFCTPEQVEGEFRDTLGLVRFVLEAVGLDDYRLQLSLREPGSDKYAGDPAMWEKAEGILRQVLTESGMDFVEEEGEAAFYGPKADFMVRDAIGREWQLGTVQLDFLLPERFDLEYVGSDNQPHRPVMIHRAPFGSMERFTGMLIEHFAAAFPLWLAPEQVRVLPLTDEMQPYSQEVAAAFRQAGFRVSVDTQSAGVKKKIRDAQLDLVPYMLIVGPKDAERGGCSVRDRIDGDLGFLPLADAVAKLAEERDERVVRQRHKTELPATAQVDAGGEY